MRGRAGRKRVPSPATVIALIALMVALGGIAWAATSLPKNSVTSKAIKNGQVKSADIGRGQVKSKNIGSSQVGAQAIAKRAVSAPQIGYLPAAEVTLSDDQTLTANEASLLSFGQERFDTDGSIVDSNDPQHLQVPSDGIYAIDAQVNWTSTSITSLPSGTACEISVRVTAGPDSGDDIAEDSEPDCSKTLVESVDRTAQLRRGDELAVQAKYSGSGTFTVEPDSTANWFGLTWVAPSET